MEKARPLLGSLVAVRIAVPLAALAASGDQIPGLPRYRFVALQGDSTGFYAAAREFISALGRPASLAAGAVLLVVLALVWRQRHRGPVALVAAVLAVALFLVVPISQMHPPGAAIFGWSLLWSIPLIPLRAIGELTPNSAFAVGLVLSLLANAVTVVATAYAGWYASGRRSVALGAASIFALWPLLAGLVGGSKAWGNGTWRVDAGLALYTEPLSTALMTAALALLLRPRSRTAVFALAGILLGYATVTRLSNGIVAALAVALVGVCRGRGAAAWVAAGGLSLAPVAAAYWPKGYAAQFDDPSSWPRHPFSVDYVAHNWNGSLEFGPRTLAVLVPLALVGALFLRSRFAAGLFAAWIVPTALVYSFYRVTWQHPRFLFVALPPVFILWSTGVLALLERPLRRLRALSTA